jgi:hypothetical protein
LIGLARKAVVELIDPKEFDMSAIPEIKRVVIFRNELLTADDLSTLADNNQQFRWLHNRSLHNWGIGFGFDVLGARGDTYVSVAPGYAIDSVGREIILTKQVKLPIPAVPIGIYYLVADYVPDSGESVVEQRDATACNTGGAVRLTNDPLIAWKTMAQLATGTDIVLAQIEIMNCVLKGAPSPAVRRYSGCGSMPYLRAGEIPAGSLIWNPWPAASGFTAVIDTSSARFRSVPVYMVQIIGTRTLPFVTIADSVSINNPGRSAFTLQVALPSMGGNINAPGLITPATFNQLNWNIVWMGIEG